MPAPVRIALLSVACCLTLACWIVHQVAVEELSRGDSVAVTSPVKAHLVNGFTVVYPKGVSIVRDTVRGPGTSYDLRLATPVPVTLVPLDSVLGMEHYRTEVNGAATIGYSLLTSVGIPLAAVAIACAVDPKCFGSCPTFYSDSGGMPVLEAEGFSFSIAPLFEARDLDRLRAQPDAQGVLRLETRNEALETHFLNHLELLEVRHSAHELVLPDARGRLLAVRDLRAPAKARDRAGRDLRRPLARADGSVFQTDRGTLAHAAPGRLEDEIVLEVPSAPGADSAAIVFRMRNSLLNTVLLYDMMLGDAGARSLDWVAGDLARIGPAVQLGQWYVAHMGMGVAVWRDGGWHEVGRIKDTGPVAWRDVALVVPVPPGDALRVRLSFVADNWRIDRIAVSFAVRRPTVTPHPLARALGAGGGDDTTALASLAAADGRYLETLPGQFFVAEWRTGTAPADSARTFLLASQGYYTEWIRRGWIEAGRRPTPFTPTDSALAEAVARYRQVKDSLEVRFAATRVPVR
jgi:hypothetical protein